VPIEAIIANLSNYDICTIQELLGHGDVRTRTIKT